MDEWRQSLFGQLVPEASRPAVDHSAATALEVAFGIARSEVAYVLELGRAHRLSVAGSVNGDDVWLAFGPARLRFVYDRRNGVITATVPGHDETTLAWDAAARVVIDPSRRAAGGAFDVRAFVRTAIDATVAAWKAEESKKPEG